MKPFSMFILLVLVSAGCRSFSVSRVADPVASSASAQVESLQAISMLSLIGGLSLIAGMALLVVTAGRKGWFPSIGGVILVVLNFLMSRYSDLIFYPLVLCTGLISAAWTYRTIIKILNEKRTHDNHRDPV